MNRLKVFLKSPEKKNLFKMTKEFFTLMIKKKEIPFYYFKYLYQKDIPNYLDYLSLTEQRKIQLHPTLHTPNYVALINNKLYFSLLSKHTKIKMPKLLGFNFKTSFFYNNEVVQIYNVEGLNLFLENIFYRENVNGIFFRPPSDYGGKGCFKITRLNFKKQLVEVYNILKTGDFVYTEVIEQHSLINQIHSKSINTLRLVSLRTSKNEIEIISAYIRFGVGDNIVDNASSGGFFVGINIENGTLKAVGYFKPEFGGQKPTEHPDSGFRFNGFEIPFYEEACESVINASRIIPDRLIGWDVAITPDGPVIIESNAEPGMHTSDIAYGGLLRNPYVKELMGELN
ncbi:hypothetical protein DIS18_04120 [Algibacter marinivivus]|uniref:Alpha-L-glutamate ligase-related protein ATP-grasp domain-containing protein n=1 Tax=Algibacter marinivivus TaxID=2100723 RepID=A0A2U2X7I9_9FLAO|nr:sugar-transfer associated ATP-grasp domain-containing protein [Algibacter marinivivus]PWH83748.1 hypothetical protein DIS18_04120 [Algibacter marinivivus]